MTKRTADGVLEELSALLMGYLRELTEIDSTDENYAFVCGEKTAFVECLEVIQSWEKADRTGLNFDIERCVSLI